jgi:putative hydrolase of the HAD superfamily
MDSLMKQLKLEGVLDFCVTSAEVGAEKPFPPIFRAALERAAVEPANAYHVGDQYKADVQGAKAVGITPVLLDREGLRSYIQDCPRITSLGELEKLLATSC